jgi:hypothetical protein
MASPATASMMSLPVRLASALVRAWTIAYTWRMEPVHRDARRAEIESDLWESAHDRLERPSEN